MMLTIEPEFCHWKIILILFESTVLEISFNTLKMVSEISFVWALDEMHLCVNFFPPFLKKAMFSYNC
jgi:hypothetical protein